MTSKEFQQKVLERSYEMPVLVDFWAPWCGPCRVLGPTLDKLAQKYAGKWELVKVNTEDSADIARDYRIMSIPNVKLFYEGRVIDEFAGALPAGQIEAWLQKSIPDKSMKELEKILASSAGPLDSDVTPNLEKFVEDHPDNREGRVALAKHQLLSDPQRATELVEEIQLGEETYETARDIRTMAGFMNMELSEEELVGRLLGKARQFISRGELALGLQTLIDATAADKQYKDDLPRKVTISLFHLLGPEHPLTRQYRRNFDMVLY